MEFLEGGNLAFHLRKLKKFNEKQVKFISAEIICGLLVLHSKGIIHWSEFYILKSIKT